ncbi:ABC-2 type transport system permease protein [Motilibacter peucedani]|uniref:ABC-2 type transport system permease protein n=1 Tax=Motilibacter peucedani TaxID=598650 RepID=A0A420XUZ7_9ACTN|nr:ABC transporter permease [Motilibacter peucedani]RKS80673.1 ABC-2 type transport system permease protein [Motilibacter peucedani]
MSRALVVARWELRSFAALWRVRLCLLVCLLAPFAFVAGVRGQTQLPEDSLFGRWVTESGFALPLLVLGFVAQWAAPALTALVAGDVFSGEDARGTWKTVLTRSTSRGEVFAGKVLAAVVWTVVLMVVLTASSTAAGLLVVGRQPLVGLSGQLVPAGHALPDVLGSWALTLPPVLGFTCLALALSVVTRSSVVGVVGPVLVGLAMQLYPFLGRSDVIGHLLLAFHLTSWHTLLLEQPGLRPVLESLAVSAAYACAALGVAWWRFSDRDELG